MIVADRIEPACRADRCDDLTAQRALGLRFFGFGDATLLLVQNEDRGAVFAPPVRRNWPPSSNGSIERKKRFTSWA